MNNIGNNIRKYREEKNITQDALAENLSVTRQAVSNWECGKTQPDIDTLQKISSILDVSIEEIIYGEKRQTTIIQNINNGQTVQKTVKNGIGFGAALAMVVSYTAWQSIPWAILHGIFGWVYVIYYAVKY